MLRFFLVWLRHNTPKSCYAHSAGSSSVRRGQDLDMKYAFVITVLFLCSCSERMSESDIDVVVATKSLQYLLSKCVADGGIFFGEMSYEQPIGKRLSYCNQSGAYIKYGGVFVEEYGLYMPGKGISVVESSSTDPSYKNISGLVYSYRIRG